MAIQINTGFNLNSPQVVDWRQVLTLEQMKDVSGDLDKVMPYKYFCLCIDDGNMYFYCRDNEKTEATGRFVPYKLA